MKPRKRFLKSRPGRFCDHWPTPKVQPGLLELIYLSGFHRSSDLAHSGHMHLLKHFRILIFETDSAIQFRILILGNCSEYKYWETVRAYKILHLILAKTQGANVDFCFWRGPFVSMGEGDQA
jgi:hypothetical protein